MGFNSGFKGLNSSLLFVCRLCWKVVMLPHGRELTETLKQDVRDQSVELKLDYGLSVQLLHNVESKLS